MKSRPDSGRPAAASLALFTLLAALSATAQAGPLPELDVTAGMRPTASTKALGARARAQSTLLRIATPASYDERYDVPTFLWATRPSGVSRGTLRAQRTTIEADARQHLGLLADLYRLQAVDVADAPLRYVHDTGTGGLVAAFTQQVEGIDVFRDEVKVLMDRDHQLLAVSGYIPGRDLVAKTGVPQFTIDAPRALDVALSDFSGRPSAAGARALGPAEG